MYRNTQTQSAWPPNTVVLLYPTIHMYTHTHTHPTYFLYRVPNLQPSKRGGFALAPGTVEGRYLQGLPSALYVKTCVHVRILVRVEVCVFLTPEGSLLEPGDKSGQCFSRSCREIGGLDGFQVGLFCKSDDLFVQARQILDQLSKGSAAFQANMQFAGDAWNEELEGSYAEVRVLLR